MEKSIRVLVANRPRLMRETILATFADQPDIEIVGEVDEESEISESVRRTMPNFSHLSRPSWRTPTHLRRFASRASRSACNRRGAGEQLRRLLLGFTRYSFQQH